MLGSLIQKIVGQDMSSMKKAVQRSVSMEARSSTTSEGATAAKRSSGIPRSSSARLNKKSSFAPGPELRAISEKHEPIVGTNAECADADTLLVDDQNTESSFDNNDWIDQTHEEEDSNNNKVQKRNSSIVRWVETQVTSPSQAVQLQQMETRTWTLNQFKTYKKDFLNGETNSTGDTEHAPIRTSLINVGRDIEMSSVFMANLRMSMMDIDPSRANTEPGDAEGGIYFAIALKLVDSIVDVLDAHFEVDFKSSCGTFNCKLAHFLTSIPLDREATVFMIVPIKKLERMGPTASLDISVKCFVYRPRTEWRLDQEELTQLDKFMRAGRIETGTERGLVKSLIEKCSKVGLTGITESMKYLGRYNFFADESFEEY